MPSRLGIDVGGTHTDFLLFEGTTGRIHALKTPSTPDDPLRAIQHGLEELMHASGIQADEITDLVHGTTLPVNLVLERKGAKVGLLVTRDFEQVLHLARGRTPGPLTGWMHMDNPEALADLGMTRGIVERVSAHGDTITQLDEAAARQAIAELLQAGAETLTVSLLHSYANPAHELQLKAIIREMNEKIPVSLSCELTPEAGEYERTLASVMNAYVQPGMQRYLGGLEDRLKSVQAGPEIKIVQSSGSLTSARQAAETPVQAMTAGPAGGAAGAARIAMLAGYPDALSLDMGGTSADIALIRNGMARMANQTNVGGEPVTVPSLNVRSIGAGGGLIAHMPMPGMLRVGPQSAGAVPGPACYGRGGKTATVTDAHVVLGRLPGAHLSLDVQAAANVMAAFGRELGLDRHRAAEGIIDIANESMAGALRLAAVEKNQYPGNLALVTFGGAGPMHGCALGTLTGAQPVIVPRNAGVLSALGFLTSDTTGQFTQGVCRTLDNIGIQQIGEIIERLGARAAAWLAAEGGGGTRRVNYRADVRYFRQEFQTSLEVDPVSLAHGGLNALAARLGDAHHRRFGMKLDQPVEIVALRAIAAVKEEHATLPKSERGGPDPAAARIDETQVYFDGGFTRTAIFKRKKLTAGNRIPGPAIIVQKDATTVIHPGHIGEVDDYLNILIRTEGAAPGRRH